MATQALHTTFLAPSATTTQSPATKPLLRRLFDLIIEIQMRRAEQEIARHMRMMGMKFTDDAECKPERQYLGSLSKL